MKFNAKEGWKITICEICKKNKNCSQHHLERSFGKKSSDVIWTCFKCHRNIHDNTAEAYKKGYLKRHDFAFKDVKFKELKAKKCGHTKFYFDSKLGFNKCQFCGKNLEKKT